VAHSPFDIRVELLNWFDLSLGLLNRHWVLCLSHNVTQVLDQCL
jgi:hypothetical protein